jgi:cellulose synthase operon protein C
VRAARAAGADDIAIGALSRTRWSAPARELRALVAPTGDPWLRLLGDERAALAAALTDDYVTAEAILREALDRCRSSRLRYRCSLLLLKLMDVHGWNHRVQPAIAAASEARALAAEGNFLPLFVRATGQLAVFEAHRDAHGLAHVYAAETVLWGEPCVEVQEARHYLADTALEEHDFSEARRQMAAVERCPERSTRFGLAGAGVLSELVRDPKDGWVEARPWLDEALAAVRRSPVRSPPREAFASMLQGQSLIEREPEQGRMLLRRAIDEVKALPRPSILGDKARAHAFIGLIGDAASRAAYDEALRLTLALEGLPDPGGCLVAVAHHFIRTSVVARGPTGKLVGRFHPRSTEPPGEMVLPAEVRGVLAGCAAIPVVAPAPVCGAPHLLPADWAWAYAAAPRGGAPAAQGSIRRLVVSNVPSPASMHLPPLRRWRGAARTGEEAIDLHGQQATPAAVLAAMTEADVIELHVHGIRDRTLTDAIALVLSAGDGSNDNAYLTPADLGKLTLRRHPLVLLGACQAARGAHYGPLASSLPAALLRAGAKLVLASPDPINDADAGPLLDEFQHQLATGLRPAVALQKVRASFLARHPAHWSRELVLFESFN